MSDNAQYDELVRQQSQTQSDISSCRRTIDSLENKISRLSSVLSTLNSLENDFNDMRKDVRRYVSDQYDWKGTRYDKFGENSSELTEANDTYWDNLDNARDEVNRALTRLENERLNQCGLLGNLISALNWIGTEIENLVNNTGLI